MERRIMASPNSTLNAVWNLVRFHVADVLLMGVRFCSAYYLSTIIDPLLDAVQPDQQHMLRKPFVHADDTRVRTPEMEDEYF
jgi:hypothetical protein